jgi:phenylalanyl-tRNA synthetase beta subunit
VESNYGPGSEVELWTRQSWTAEDSYASQSLTEREIEDRKRVAKDGLVYTVRADNDPCFFPGMSAEVILIYAEGTEKRAGVFGVVHPEVLQQFELIYPCSAVEMDIEMLM